MPKRDAIDDLVDLIHPLLDRRSVSVSIGLNHDHDDLDGDPDGELDSAEISQDAYEAMREEIEHLRHDFEMNLRAAQDAVTDFYEFDPLINEIARAHREQREAESRLRLLLAYAREFTPRAYPLADLAEASGMSTSGVRTAYTYTEIGDVTARIHRYPRDVITALRLDAADDECAVTGGKRHQRGANCTNPPTTIGGTPDPKIDQEFRVCTAHAWLVSDPRPIPGAATNGTASATVEAR